jgi:raffinose/stachyose/melibiose transport system substrate-binding protein
MNKKGRSLALLVAAGLALGLVGCSGSGGGSGKTQLVVWDPGLLTKVRDDGKIDPKSSFLNQAAANYEKSHPGTSIKVVRTSLDLSASAAQFQSASLAGNGPDIRMGYTGGNTLSYSRYLLDLAPVLTSETKKNVVGLDTVRAGYKPTGKLLGLPYDSGSYFYVFYNKKLAKAAGLDLSTPPKSWEDLISMAEKVKSSGKTPFWLADQEGYVGAWVISALVGGELGSNAFMDMYNGKVPVDDPAMVKAYQAFAGLYSKGLTNPDAGSVANADAGTGFIQGKAVFHISGGWENDPLNKAMGDNVGEFPIPMLADAKYPAAEAGGPQITVSITNYSKHLDAAKDFVRYLAKPSTTALFAKMTQGEPSDPTQADPALLTNPLGQAEVKQLKGADAVTFPFDNVMPQAVIDLFYRVSATTFLGKTTPQDAVQQIKASYKREIANQ